MAITKIDSSMLEDVSGADNLVKLDANAKIPAGTGANLLNKPGPFTSASDPAIDSNKALGTEWLNTTSGEMYVCTDATTGANIWTNVGAGSGDISRYSWQGESFGYVHGGAGPSNEINRYSFATATAAGTDIGDLVTSLSGAAGLSSKTHGYACGGLAGPHTNQIQKFDYSASVTTSDWDDLSSLRASCAPHSDGIHGFLSGGYLINGAEPTVIEKFPFASASGVIDVGDMNFESRPAGCQSDTHGYPCGGEGTNPDHINKFAFASIANATSHGDLNAATGAGGGGVSSTTHGYVGGGVGSSNVIQKFAFASNTTGTDVGNLTTTVSGMTAPASSTTYGYVSGSYPPSNVIQRWSFSSDGNATDVGDLTYSTYGMCGSAN
jgi:hypothetical protein